MRGLDHELITLEDQRLLQKFDRLKAKNTLLQKELCEARVGGRTLQARLDSAMEESAASKLLLGELQLEMESIMSKFEELQQHCHRVSRDNTLLREELVKAEGLLSEQKGSSIRLLELERNFGELKAETEALRSMRQLEKEQVCRLEKELARTKSRATLLEKSSLEPEFSRVEDLQDETLRLRTKITELSFSNQELESSLQQARVEAERKGTKLSEMRDLVRSMQRAIELQTKQAASLMAQFEKAEKLSSGLCQDLSLFRTCFHELKDQAEDLLAVLRKQVGLSPELTRQYKQLAFALDRLVKKQDVRKKAHSKGRPQSQTSARSGSARRDESPHARREPSFGMSVLTTRKESSLSLLGSDLSLCKTDRARRLLGKQNFI